MAPCCALRLHIELEKQEEFQLKGSEETMIDPLRTRAMGEAKQARYLEEAESRRMMRLSTADRSTLALRLGQTLGWGLVYVGQQLQAAGAHLARIRPEADRANSGS